LGGSIAELVFSICLAVIAFLDKAEKIELELRVKNIIAEAVAPMRLVVLN
jgi:hypothetical protein